MTAILTKPEPVDVPTAAASTVPAWRRGLRHSLVLAKRNLIKTWRTPEQLIDVTLQPVIFLMLFVYVFGGAIAGGSRHEYLQYLLPGLLGQGIAMGSIALGQNMNADIEKGVFDRFRSLPIPRSAPLLGAVLGDVVRYVIVTVSTLAMGYIMGFRVESDPFRALAACLLAVLFALCLSWMPVWMRGFVKVNPITHLVESMRALFGGTPVGSHVWWTLGWCVVFVVVFMPLALRAYRKKV